VPIGRELRRQGVTGNQDLSMTRAQTVVQFLISQGINPNLLTAQGLGDTAPVASNDTAAGHAHRTSAANANGDEQDDAPCVPRSAWLADLGHAKLAIINNAEEISVHPAPREA
jgi:hypothetical protein